MKVIVAGHEYEVSNLEKDRVVGHIQFVEKKVINGKLVKTKDGTTSEELIRVLIDRIQHLDTVIPCKENTAVIRNLKAALIGLEDRRADREKRGVLGKDEE